MLIMGKAVLAFGIFSVFGVAVHNHSRAGAQAANVSTAAVQAAAPAIAAPTAGGLPRAYWSNPATSPLQGIGMPAVQSSGPIRQASIAWRIETRGEIASDEIQLATRLPSEGSN